LLGDGKPSYIKIAILYLNMEKEELQKLFRKYHEGRCTEEEKALLEAWYLEFNEHELEISPNSIKAIGQKIFRELPDNYPIFLKTGIKLALAAGLIGLMVTVAVRSFLPAANPEKVADTATIRPGGNAAILTLSDGQKINLSSAKDGQIAKQAGIRIYKTARGQISYTSSADPAASAKITNNQITTPKGGQWQITLPDGSKVLLNSASSLS